MRRFLYHKSKEQNFLTLNELSNYSKSIKENKFPYFDIKYRSRYGDINFLKNSILFNDNNKQRIHVSDWLMFNKYNVEQSKIERILSNIKFNSNDNSYHIDKWKYTERNESYFDRPYHIEYDDNIDISKFKLISTDEEKRLASRAIIQIMNETPESMRNNYNYNSIGEWYFDNDLLLQYRTMNEKLDNIDTHIEQDNYFVNIDNLMTQKELDDIFDYNCKINNIEFYVGDSNIKHDIDNIEQKKLYLQNYEPKINNSIIDLTSYAKIYGNLKCKKFIDALNSIIKYRFNCKNIPSEILLSNMFNNIYHYGLGCFDTKNKEKITVQEARDILNDRKYFDYLYGKALKFDFEDYPIVDYRRFDDYNGKGKFIEIISLISNTIYM